MKNFKVALQLYSIREDMASDMDAALGAVKAMGYDYVEFAGYYGKTAEEVRALLDKHGLECVSVHQGAEAFEEDGQAAVDFLKTIGAKYCAIPWYELDKLRDSFAETAELFAKTGKLLKDNGIALLYHNHDFEFTKVDGQYILDKLFATVPSDLLNPQLDTCWVHYAGVNPAECVEKYSGRVRVLHLKDFVCKNLGGGPVYALIGADGKEEKAASQSDNGFELRPVGYGIQDFPAILAAAEKAGVEIVVVEQDESVDRPPLEAAKMSREYLKGLGI